MGGATACRRHMLTTPRDRRTVPRPESVGERSATSLKVSLVIYLGVTDTTCGRPSQRRGYDFSLGEGGQEGREAVIPRDRE